MAELISTIGKFEYDNLIGGCEIPALTKIVTISNGAGVLPRGHVLGKVTADGKCVSVDSTNTDGSEKPYCVLVRQVDASAFDIDAEVYVSGIFNREALTFGGTDTAEKHEDALRTLNMYLTSEKPGGE